MAKIKENLIDSRPKALEIDNIFEENDVTRTYVFKHSLGALPGQFVMFWVPGVDEKPFSVAYDDGNEFWITICKVGPATEKIFDLKIGDKVGIRGPYGTFYNFNKGDRLALVSGGYGAAPMFNVANVALNRGAKVSFFTGARTDDLLLYKDKVLNLNGISSFFSTNDGSFGHRGYVTDLLLQEMDKNGFDKIFACGPEMMMKAIGVIAEENGVECFLSVEKYMKCGFGVCGQCTIDDTGECVCTKGPVMNWNYLKNLPEFGKYHRNAQGKKIFFN